MRLKQKAISLLLSAALIISIVPQTVFAAGTDAQDSGAVIGASSLCENHMAHDEDCGYVEGTEGSPCTHEHGEECYTTVTSCTHTNTEDCCPVLDNSVSGDTATPSEAAEPTECTHVCSEESGCVTKKLNCPHEHDEACGYSPAADGSPCTHVCELCALTEIASWSWVDEMEVIDPENGVLALPGASEEAPALFGDITALLPASITAAAGDGAKTVALDGWACPEYPEAGAYTGSYVFTAKLPKGYTLAAGAPALRVTVELGGAAMLEAPAAHTHPICGKVHTNIGDHTTATEVTFDKELSSDLSNHLCADGTWVQAESVNGRDYYVLPAGNYYLKADATIDKTILIKEGEVNICLNGHELCLNQGGVRVWEVIQINGGTLNLTDCQGGGKVCHLDYTYGRGVTLKGTGDAIMKFNMYGGNICENTHKLSTNSEAYGGGVAVESQNGTFNMYGGSISNNEASMSGKSNAHSGGVYNAGKFHLYDGAIESNKAYVASGGGRCFGGGVSNSGTFIMSGGRISKNRVSGQSNKEMYGGGVYNRERSQFTMSGGEISENTVTSYAASAYGGGVYNGGIFTLSDGGKISKNAVSGHSNEEMCGGGVYNVKINAKMVMSGGVYASAGKFNMNGKASVTKNTVNGVFVSDHAEFIRVR